MSVQTFTGERQSGKSGDDDRIIDDLEGDFAPGAPENETFPHRGNVVAAIGVVGTEQVIGGLFIDNDGNESPTDNHPGVPADREYSPAEEELRKMM